MKTARELDYRLHHLCIYDGNPPPDPYEEDLWADEPEAGEEAAPIDGNGD
mgnify:CR=1 FL=1